MRTNVLPTIISPTQSFRRHVHFTDKPFTANIILLTQSFCRHVHFTDKCFTNDHFTDDQKCNGQNCLLHFLYCYVSGGTGLYVVGAKPRIMRKFLGSPLVDLVELVESVDSVKITFLYVWYFSRIIYRIVLGCD